MAILFSEVSPHPCGSKSPQRDSHFGRECWNHVNRGLVTFNVSLFTYLSHLSNFSEESFHGPVIAQHYYSPNLDHDARGDSKAVEGRDGRVQA
jgi:hypothetical protein